MNSKQSILRLRIADIQQSSVLTPEEKTNAIRALIAMTNQSDVVVASPELIDNNDFKCPHYDKKCSQFYFSCCKVVDPCHRCHLERGCNVKPPMIEMISCSVCNLRQVPSSSCCNCGTLFSKSFCSKCMLWTSFHIYHCDLCGLCRLTGEHAVPLFHCKNCDVCYSTELRDNHICAKSSWRHEKCPYCLEGLHSSQKRSIVLPCGHISHESCLQTAIIQERLCCPMCRKSVCDLSDRWEAFRHIIRLTPLPPNWPLRPGHRVRSPYGMVLIENMVASLTNDTQIYKGKLYEWTLADKSHPSITVTRKDLGQNSQVQIFCSDCLVSDLAYFHELGLECSHCGSFNTVAK